MQFMPAVKLGWLNGWILLAWFYLIFAILMLTFPRNVVARLYDISSVSINHRILATIGQPFALVGLVLLFLTPLKIGQFVFVVGITLFVIGFIGYLSALFTFKKTPDHQLVTGGLYRISRNPQWVSLVLTFLGSSIAIGSWAAVFLFLVSAIFIHFRILGEEEACLKQYSESYRNYMNSVPRYFLFL